METTILPSNVIYNLGPVARIPIGEGRTFQVGQELISVFRARGGAIFAAQAHCPHRGGPLADGIIGAGKVICPLHAYKFDLQTGKPIDTMCEALKLYEVALSAAGDILLTISSQRGE
jgi:nitrite reductase (NADH) small subunit